MSAAASGVGDRVSASRASFVARPARTLAGTLLLILAISLSYPLHAESDDRLAWLKADKGRAALLRGQYREAAELLGSALQSSSLSYEGRVIALEARGVARWRLHELRPALDDLNAAVVLAPEDAALYNNRGNVLLELGSAEQAVSDFGRAILLSPYFAAAYSNRGNARVLMGELAGAIADFTIAIGLAPDSAASFNGRGKAQLALRHPAAAVRDFSRAIVLKANYAQAFANRAEALTALERYDDAVADFNAAIKLGVATAQIFAERGAAYAAMNRPRLAIADFGKAAKLDLPVLAASVSILAPAAQARMWGNEHSPLAGAASAAPRPPGPLRCDSQHEAAAEPDAAFRQVADASARALPSSLVYRINGTAEGALGRDARDAALQQISPCGAPSVLVPEDKSPILPETEAWSVTPNTEGDYVATLLQRPPIRLTLEMYGEGLPELLHWQTLHGAFGGVGLLHYFAGIAPSGERLEYIALIDTVSGRLIGIEPCQFGATRARWTWGDDNLVVVDPQGVPSRLQLRGRGGRADPAHVKRSTRAHRSLPPRFARKARNYDPASHLAFRSVRHGARMQAGNRGYAPHGRFSLK